MFNRDWSSDVCSPIFSKKLGDSVSKWLYAARRISATTRCPTQVILYERKNVETPSSTSMPIKINRVLSSVAAFAEAKPWSITCLRPEPIANTVADDTHSASMATAKRSLYGAT